METKKTMVNFEIKNMAEFEAIQLVKTLEKLGFKEKILKIERVLVKGTLWFNVEIETMIVLHQKTLKEIGHLSISESTHMIQFKNGLNLDIRLKSKY